jgi:hypothetical protein
MEVNKLRRIVDKYQLSNLIKVLILLIILYVLARIFIPSFNKLTSELTSSISQAGNFIKPQPMLEGFSSKIGSECYGNQIILQDPNNNPIYNGNKVTFGLNDTYRMEGLLLKFNSNPNTNTTNGAISSFNNNNLVINIQYEDGNGTLKYVTNGSSTSSLPNFSSNITGVGNSASPYSLALTTNGLVDEYGLIVYTSKIVITIGDSSNKMDTFSDRNGNGYISNFALWGSSRDMPSKSDFNKLNFNTELFTNTTSTTAVVQNINTYNFTHPSDYLVYGIALPYSFNQVNSPNKTSSPFVLSLSYTNGLYPGNIFNINQKYYIRNDSRMYPDNATNITYIIFPLPIIARTIIVSIPQVNIIGDNSSTNMLALTIANNQNMSCYGNSPTNTDIATYKKTVNLLLNAANTTEKLDVCPSMDELMSKQNQAQAICDNLDYQDRIKAEKIRLEKNKQYLLKLQEQQKQIDQLNSVIQTLDSKRQIRDKNTDMARLLQYQQQKQTASTVRDLANQRLQNQAANQLYMDVNINTI